MEDLAYHPGITEAAYVQKPLDTHLVTAALFSPLAGAQCLESIVGTVHTRA